MVVVLFIVVGSACLVFVATAAFVVSMSSLFLLIHERFFFSAVVFLALVVIGVFVVFGVSMSLSVSWMCFPCRYRGRPRRYCWCW